MVLFILLFCGVWTLVFWLCFPQPFENLVFCLCEFCDIMPRIKKFGKNKFKGNRYSIGKVATDNNSSAVDILGCESRPSTSLSLPKETSTSEPDNSASESKLIYLPRCGDDSEYLSSKNTKGNYIINLEILNKILLSSAKCVDCDSVGLQIIEIPENRKGLAVNLGIVCNECGFENYFYSSRKTEKSFFDVNLRCVYGFRSIGKGKSAADTLCAVMDLPKPPSRFQLYNEIIHEATEEIAEATMTQAAREAVTENDGEKDIAGVFDGTWQKRGHTSLNGVFTVTSMDTGKVLDAVVLSKHCSCSKMTKLGKSHAEKCTKNYEGSSGGMEVAAAKEVFKRSELKRGVRYVKYLGDGDSSAFSSVQQSKPYGDSVEITKLECVGHIQKRMGSRLRRLKAKLRGSKLSDDKPISGRGRLTDSLIDNIQTYYGKAIRDNLEDVDKMRTAVWATYFHLLSTDNIPRHELCPKGELSWCKYQRSLISGEKYTHKHSVPEPVMCEIKPIFRDLSNIDLLRKCLHGRTQNPNESFNNVIWTRIPKNTFVGIKTLKVGVLDAIISFNCGALGKVQVIQKLCGDAGGNCVVGLKQIDQNRVLDANKAALECTKSKRKQKRNIKRKREDKDEESTAKYGAGLF